MSRPQALSGEGLLQRFERLDAFLSEHQALWRPRPFVHLTLPWETNHPALAHWLRQRSLAEAEADHLHPQRLLEAPAPFAHLARSSAELIELSALPATPARAHNPHRSTAVPGRKLEQIAAFSRALSFQSEPQHWLDWCAGKGHLAHWLGENGAPFTCFEHDPELVSAGQAITQRLHLNGVHQQQDVLDEHLRLQATHTPVALHACGDLHVRLLERAADAGCQQLAIAPCCYNRISNSHYQPLSARARSSKLRLSRDDLGLPLSETVTAGERVRRQRDHSMARRLAFDLLQRSVRPSNEYLPTPSLPAAWLSKPFADYCKALAALKDIQLQGEHDWHALEAAGWRRLAEVRNLELLRNLFRRPLELWLTLDKALFLQEHGYRARLGTFCDIQVTPRNLLLIAEREAVDNSVSKF